MPDIHGDKTVLTIAYDASSHLGFPSELISLSPKEEPPLKLIQATQRIIVPRTTEFGLDAAKLLSSSVN